MSQSNKKQLRQENALRNIELHLLESCQKLNVPEVKRQIVLANDVRSKLNLGLISISLYDRERDELKVVICHTPTDIEQIWPLVDANVTI